jgi:hypothetical protein
LWFYEKKKGIIQKLSGLDKNQKNDDLVSKIVMEDIAELFCYIIKNAPALSCTKQGK